jgi:hypothetical protein
MSLFFFSPIVKQDAISPLSNHYSPRNHPEKETPPLPNQNLWCPKNSTISSKKIQKIEGHNQTLS